MSSPTHYTVEDLLKTGCPPDDQSIFSSIHFRQHEVMYHSRDRMPFRQFMKSVRFDDTEEDIVAFFRNCEVMCAMGDIGLGSQIEDYKIAIEPVTTHLVQVGYELGCTDPVHYFPSEELVHALRHTDLQWIDVDAFKALPKSLSIRVPKGELQFWCDGRFYSLDDLLLYQVNNPLIRRHFLRLHGLPPESDAQVWYWMLQSREELSQGLQNSFFGPMVLTGHTKLSDLLKGMEEWSKEADAGFTASFEAQGTPEYLRKVAEAPVTTELGRFHRDAAKNLLTTFEDARSIETSEARFKAYRQVMEFILKFVLLLNSGAFDQQEIPLPGWKPGKTSTKAREIQAKLRYKYGTRIFVTLEKQALEAMSEDSADRLGPVRHLVRGHFKLQPHGPGNSLRKTIFRTPFWRGEDRIERPD